MRVLRYIGLRERDLISDAAPAAYVGANTSADSRPERNPVRCDGARSDRDVRCVALARVQITLEVSLQLCKCVGEL